MDSIKKNFDMPSHRSKKSLDIEPDQPEVNVLSKSIRQWTSAHADEEKLMGSE